MAEHFGRARDIRYRYHGGRGAKWCSSRSLAPFYSWLQRQEAGPDLVDSGGDRRGGAAVSGPSVTYRTMDGNYAGGLVTLTVNYRDFQDGIFSLRVYEAGFQLIPMSSVVSANQLRWNAGSGTHTMAPLRVPLFPEADHTYDVELYWNGTLLATRTLVPVQGGCGPRAPDTPRHRMGGRDRSGPPGMIRARQGPAPQPWIP